MSATPALSEILLERYLAGDLPAAQAQAVEDACRRSPAWQARLEMLRQERESFYQDNPPDRFAQRVAACISEEDRVRKSRKWWLLWTAPSFAALTAVVLGVVVVDQVGDAPPAVRSEAAEAAEEIEVAEEAPPLGSTQPREAREQTESGASTPAPAAGPEASPRVGAAGEESRGGGASSKKRQHAAGGGGGLPSSGQPAHTELLAKGQGERRAERARRSTSGRGAGSGASKRSAILPESQKRGAGQATEAESWADQEATSAATSGSVAEPAGSSAAGPGASAATRAPKLAPAPISPSEPAPAPTSAPEMPPAPASAPAPTPRAPPPMADAAHEVPAAPRAAPPIDVEDSLQAGPPAARREHAPASSRGSRPVPTARSASADAASAAAPRVRTVLQQQRGGHWQHVGTTLEPGPALRLLLTADGPATVAVVAMQPHQAPVVLVSPRAVRPGQTTLPLRLGSLGAGGAQVGVYVLWSDTAFSLPSLSPPRTLPSQLPVSAQQRRFLLRVSSSLPADISASPP